MLHRPPAPIACNRRADVGSRTASRAAARAADVRSVRRKVAALLLALGAWSAGPASVWAQQGPDTSLPDTTVAESVPAESVPDTTVPATTIPELPVAPASVLPIAECVIVNGDGSFTGFFGYSNDTGGDLRIPKSYANRTDEPSGRPPTSYRSGRVVAAFSVTTYDRVITWYLGEQQAIVTPESTPCSTSPTVSEAPLALLLMLAPAAMTGWWLHRRRPRRHAAPW